MVRRCGCVGVAAAVFIWAASAARAGTFFWRSDSGSGNWTDSSKWTPTGVPGAADLAAFTYSQTAPFTISFTNELSSKLSLGSSDATKPAAVTFDLNGHTLTHTGSSVEAHRALDWTLLNGTLYCGADTTYFQHAYHEFAVAPKITIGAGGVILYAPTNTLGMMLVGSRTAADFVIQDGGRLVTQSAGSDALRVGYSTGTDYTNYTAKMVITGAGSVWSNLAGSVQFSTHAKATAALTVANGGTLVHKGTSFLVGNITGANASLTVASGGVVDVRLASNYMAIGNGGTGTVTVTGTGSALLAVTNQHLYFGNLANASQGTLIIEKGGLVEKMVGNHNIQLGFRDNATGRLVVRDGGLLRWGGGFGSVAVGGGAGSGAGSVGEMTVTGATSRAIFGEFSIGQTRGNALVTVAGGATVEVYRTMYVGRIATNLVSAHNGFAKLVVTGTNSVLKKSALTAAELPNANISATISLGVGGCGFQGWDTAGLLYYGSNGPGGKGAVVVENGGLVDINGTVGVYSNSTLRIDGGRTQSGKIGIETGAVFNAVLRLGNANGAALMAASSEVRLWGPTLAVELGADFKPVVGDVYTLIQAGVLHATLNRFLFGGAVLQDGSVIQVGGTRFRISYASNAVKLTVRQTGTLLGIL